MCPVLYGTIDTITMKFTIWNLISVCVRDPKSPRWAPMCHLTQLKSFSWMTFWENTQIVSQYLKLLKISLLLSVSAASPQRRLTHPQPPLTRASVGVSAASFTVQWCGGIRLDSSEFLLYIGAAPPCLNVSLSGFHFLGWREWWTKVPLMLPLLPLPHPYFPQHS